MLRFENVATPLEALTGFVPESVPPPGLAPNANVIEFVAVETVLPELSSTATLTAGVIEDPAVTLDGCSVNASFVGTPTPPAAKFKWKFVVPPSPRTDETMKKYCVPETAAKDT